MVLFPSIFIAQTKNKKTKDEYQKGYVIYKNTKDTTYGYVKIITNKAGYLINAKFLINMEMEEDSAVTITDIVQSKDTFRFFGTLTKHYKYFNTIDTTFHARKFYEYKNKFKGWAELREQGAINLYLGDKLDVVGGVGTGMMLPSGGGMTHVGGGGYYTDQTPVYLLKRGNKPSKIIISFSAPIIHERYKNHFINCINDYPELVEKVKRKQPLLCGDIEEFIREYNVWANNNSDR